MMDEQDNLFTVMPMSQNINLVPGETYTGSVKVINPADATEDFEYQATVTPYWVSGSDYAADLATVTNWSEIVKWITIKEPTGKVKPNETKEIEFTIAVPENAAGGGQYATIAISSNDQGGNDDGVAVKNVFEMASIVYGNVEGDIIREGEIVKNIIPGFSTVTPIKVGAVINNQGNIHEAATFVISASNIFTGEVILPTEESKGEYTELIMPETERDISREINNVPAVGVVKVSQTIYYNGNVSTVEKNVIICPIWLMVVAVLVLGAIIAMIVRLIKKHKKSKKAAAAV